MSLHLTEVNLDYNWIAVALSIMVVAPNMVDLCVRVSCFRCFLAFYFNYFFTCLVGVNIFMLFIGAYNNQLALETVKEKFKGIENLEFKCLKLVKVIGVTSVDIILKLIGTTSVDIILTFSMWLLLLVLS